MGTRIGCERREGRAFQSMMRAFNHVQRAELMYGASFQRQWYYEVFARRRADVFPRRDRPEFPTYIGSDGREHAEF